MTPLYPLPRTHHLPGLGQEAAILLLQALGQRLQVLQLLVHGLGTLQGLLGAEGSRTREKQRPERQSHSESRKQQRNPDRDLGGGGVGHRNPEGKAGKEPSTGHRDPVSPYKTQGGGTETWKEQEIKIKEM